MLRWDRDRPVRCLMASEGLRVVFALVCECLRILDVVIVIRILISVMELRHA
ncbi:MAG: hypothetical protein ACFCVA_19905 [Gammaproteobacteria bacterium]